MRKFREIMLKFCEKLMQKFRKNIMQKVSEKTQKLCKSWLAGFGRTYVDGQKLRKVTRELNQTSNIY